MRAFCTVSAPLEVCAPPTRPLSPGSRFLALRLLGSPQPRTLYFLVEAKSRVREVYAQTCLHFAKQGMSDTELFGLAVLIDGEYMFADPESKLSKYGPKSWRSSHTHGLDANGRPLLELHFRVQFYIESPFMLRDETSRHNYYLQLKANAISRDVPKEYSEQSIILLGGLALQADLRDCPESDDTADSAISSGSNYSTVKAALKLRSIIAGESTSSVALSDMKPESITSSVTSLATTATSSVLPPLTSSSSSSSINFPDYFRIDEYLPFSLRTAWGANALRSCHRENRGMTRADAEMNYIRQACALHDTINAHVYRMKMSKSENGPGTVWFVVYAKGIRIYGDNTQPITFLWPNIVKLSFERKKFEIRSGDNKITLYSASDEKSKMLLALCKETHQFSMKVAARLKDAIKREEEEGGYLNACYMYSRSLNLPYKSKNDQRISVISSTSSNTTSGIVSDRVHSEDELEIMINTPPAPIAGPSTESLALAHLLDRDKASVSRQTSSVGQVSLKDLEDQLAALSKSKSKTSSISSDTNPEQSMDRSRSSEESNETDSPNSQHNIGSQCSSTCSTVVVATESAITLTTLSQHTPTNRRNSTSSSLELGFNHTAQNSTLSDGASTCIDHDFVSSTHDEDENVSGVYTLAHGAPPTETSGVYTINSSELTGQSSEIAESVSESHDSSHYGIFQPKSVRSDDGARTRDSVDGGAFRMRRKSEFRLRSDSSVSVCESFRGDGSDPTDKKHALLSAEELTDLIVGRGTYPTRKSVSATLDSDCDYVTLPLPIAGDSYLTGHEDTAPSEDSDLLPAPIPPQRIDSNPLPNLSDIRMRSPPPYNARHEKTGLSGPPLSNGLSLPKPPPPYPAKPARPTSLISNTSSTNSMSIPPLLSSSNVTTPTKSEEVPARFITTRSQINILKAHSGVVHESTKPSYAAPTISQPLVLSSSAQPHHPPYPHKKRSSHITQVPNNIGIPVVPYSIHSAHTAHKSMSSNSTPRTTCVLLPVIKPRQYLPPPPPSLPRQPPPPPPQLATVYAGPLARSQIELYQQQLYSDVDYVIYPIQDPAVSQQEYLDAKQGSILAAMAQNPPPPPYLAYRNQHSWDAYKGHAIYRSTPYLPVAFSSTQSRYASTQNLSDTYVQLPSAYSPLYSPSVTSLCSSYEPPPPLRPPTISQLAHQHQVASSLFARSRSDDNILNTIETLPKVKRQPPPPPAYVNRRLKKPPMPTPTESPPPIPVKPQTIKQTLPNPNLMPADQPAAKPTTQNQIDIQILREKTDQSVWSSEKC
ncbi:FRMD6 family protein [Megaselia abdita]